MDVRPNGRAPRGAGPLGAIAVSGVMLCATGALLVFSWARQARLEKELARARTLLDEARVRLGGRAGESKPAPERSLEILEKERAELERRAGEQAEEAARLERRVARLQEEVDRLARERPDVWPQSEPAPEAPGEDGSRAFQEHMRLTEETRALRDRLRRMVEALEDVVRDKAARAPPGAGATSAGPVDARAEGGP